MNTNFENAYNQACELVDMCPDLEITSAFKECAFNVGIKEGEEMGKFVVWGWDKITNSYVDQQRRLKCQNSMKTKSKSQKNI